MPDVFSFDKTCQPNKKSHLSQQPRLQGRVTRRERLHAQTGCCKRWLLVRYYPETTAQCLPHIASRCQCLLISRNHRRPPFFPSDHSLPHDLHRYMRYPKIGHANGSTPGCRHRGQQSLVLVNRRKECRIFVFEPMMPPATEPALLARHLRTVFAIHIETNKRASKFDFGLIAAEDAPHRNGLHPLSLILVMSADASSNFRRRPSRSTGSPYFANSFACL